jgi:hypothetical protein
MTDNWSSTAIATEKRVVDRRSLKNGKSRFGLQSVWMQVLKDAQRLDRMRL